MNLRLFYDTNISLVEMLIKACDTSHRTPHILFHPLLRKKRIIFMENQKKRVENYLKNGQ